MEIIIRQRRLQSVSVRADKVRFLLLLTQNISRGADTLYCLTGRSAWLSQRRQEFVPPRASGLAPSIRYVFHSGIFDHELKNLFAHVIHLWRLSHRRLYISVFQTFSSRHGHISFFSSVTHEHFIAHILVYR